MLPLPSAHAKRRTPIVHVDSGSGLAERRLRGEGFLPSAAPPKSSNSYSPFKTSSNGFAAEPAASAAMALAAPRPTMAMRTASSAGFRKCCEVPDTITTSRGGGLCMEPLSATRS